MRACDFMTTSLYSCTPQTKLQEVASRMVEHDVGSIPVVESEQNRKLVGMVTDRDIVTRLLAEGKNPLECTASDCMSSPVVCVSEDASLEECCRTMEEHQIRRVPVTDEQGNCCGIISQADIARQGQGENTSEVLEQVSQPAGGGPTP